jgi:arsenate reductase
MREAGFELSGNQPGLLAQELASCASLLVTMGCGEKRPYVPGVRPQDWPMPDPKGLPLDAGRRIREEIRSRVESLVQRPR